MDPPYRRQTFYVGGIDTPARATSALLLEMFSVFVGPCGALSLETIDP